MSYISLEDLEKNIQQQEYLTLDSLEEYTRKQKIIHFLKNSVKEIFNFLVFLFSFVLLGIMFVNFNVFYSSIKSFIFPQASIAGNFEVQTNGTVSSFKSISNTGTNKEKTSEISSSDNFENIKKERYKQILSKKLSDSGYNGKEAKKDMYEKSLEKHLSNKTSKYSFNFNLLPPDNRIVVPDIGVNAPIVDIPYISEEKLSQADFDGELREGVVKYPFTSNPGEKGNSFIFGHTSYYWWKDNPYGEVFSKIPSLKHGDIVKIIWNGNLYKYEVGKKLIRKPEAVQETYEYYDKENSKMLTLMGCYPIGTDAKRILVMAKKIEEDTSKEISFKNKN